MGQRKQPVTPRNRAARRRCSLLALGMLTLSAAGCASFWDEVFSRERDLGRYFNPPHPLVTIMESSDGELRAKALAALREPAQHGGSQQDQDKYIEILTTAAKADHDPYCRLCAIQALGSFKDARAAKALDDLLSTQYPFTQDFNYMIRQATLRSLAKIDTEDARRRLISIANSPKAAFDAASLDRQETLDERLIAVTAMGKYRDAASTESLVSILDRAEKEKDWAVRDAAHQSLQESTGKTLPPDPQVWRMALAGQPVNVEQPNIIQRVVGWFK